MIDGFEYVHRGKLCPECNGTGDWWEVEDGLLWFQGNCPVCDGQGVEEEHCDGCVQCEAWTCNRSHGDYVCTDCDVSRHEQPVINYPVR